jgi:hypothetical protein
MCCNKGSGFLHCVLYYRAHGFLNFLLLYLCYFKILLKWVPSLFEWAVHKIMVETLFWFLSFVVKEMWSLQAIASTSRTTFIYLLETLEHYHITARKTQLWKMCGIISNFF